MHDTSLHQEIGIDSAGFHYQDDVLELLEADQSYQWRVRACDLNLAACTDAADFGDWTLPFSFTAIEALSATPSINNRTP